MKGIKLTTLSVLIVFGSACGYKADLVMPGDSKQTKTTQEKDEQKRKKNGTSGQ